MKKIDQRTLLFLIGVTAFIKSALFSFLGFNLIDVGDRLYSAQRILAGELPYRDFFAIFPPLNDYFYAFSFFVFGGSVLAARILASFIFAFFPVLIFLIAKRLMPLKYALIPSLLVIFLDVNIERFYYFTPIYLALYLSVLAFERKNAKIYFLAGLFFGLGSLIRLDFSSVYLISSLLGIGLYFYYQDSKLFLKRGIIFSAHVLAGYIIFPLSVFIWMIKNNILTSFIQEAIKQSVIITRVHSLPFKSVFDIVPQNLSIQSILKSYDVFYGNLILVIYFITAVFILKKFKEFWLKTPCLGILLFAGLLALPYFFGRSEAAHMTRAGMPFLILGSYLLYQAARIRKDIFKVLGIGIILALFIYNLAQSFWWIGFNDTEISLDKNKIIINSQYYPGSTIPSAKTLVEAVKFLQDNSSVNEPVLVLPYMAGLYYLSERSNPTKFNNVENGMVLTEVEESNFIKLLDNKKVKVVIYDPFKGPVMKVNVLKEYNPRIHNYIMDKFEIVKTTPEGWLFMRSKL